jgi:Iron-containing redox enzyme
MLLPEPRGPLTSRLQVLRAPADVDLNVTLSASHRAVRPEDDDAQLALWILYELHYQGFDDVDPVHEWAPELIAVRRQLEQAFEQYLRRLTAPRVETALGATGSVAERLFAMIQSDDGPRLSSYVQRSITRHQLHEMLKHRSVYQLKEADPHSFAIPRLRGAAKAALVEIQFDEYGGGRADDMHSTLFAQTLRECGLDDTYGAYVEQVPGETLAVSNAMSLFGLNRRLRAAAAGHLAAFEATSSLPNRRYAAGVRRLGYGDAAARYFEEHVEADAVHEQVAVREMCGALVADEPAELENVLFGAAACLALDGLAGQRQLSAWQSGRSSLRVATTRPAVALARVRPSVVAVPARQPAAVPNASR